MGREQAVNWQTGENRPRIPQISFTDGEEGVILLPAENRRISGLFSENRGQSFERVSGMNGKSDATGWVYFIRAPGPNGLVKIGFARQPVQRLIDLQIGSPVELTLIGCHRGTMADETGWHRRFAHLRVRGEWFRYEPDLRKAIKPHLYETRDRLLAKLNKEYDDLHELLAKRKEIATLSPEGAAL